MNEFDPYKKWLGIQHANRPVDHYELLGIKRFESDVEVIEAAVARLVAQLQDVASGSKHVEASQRILNDVARARLCLTDARKRAEYDRQLTREEAKIVESPSNSVQSSTLYLTGYAATIFVAAGLAIGAAFFVTKGSNPEVANTDRFEITDPEDQTSDAPGLQELTTTKLSPDAERTDESKQKSREELDQFDAPLESVVAETPTPAKATSHPGPKTENELITQPGEEATNLQILFTTSFENLKPAMFQSLKLDDVDIQVVGTASINPQFAHSGRQCLRLHGDPGNSITFVLPPSLQGARGISFQAERWTSRSPFEISVELQQKGSWKQLVKLDKHIKVGKRFLSDVKIAIPSGSTTAIRLNLKTAPDAGLLIDDFSLLAAAPESTIPIPRRTLEYFVKHFDLPALGDTAETMIDDLTISNRFLMGAKLFVHAEATRKKISFEMRRSDNDKQRWIVTKQKPVDEHAVDVASFWRTDDEFLFQWLPAAQLDPDTNYLRNAALKLETPDGQTSWLDLRKPVLIKNFQIPEAESSVRVKTELPWMPTPKSVVVEIFSFPNKDVPSHCIPEYVSKDPGKMYFTREQAKAFFWLEVTAARRDEYVLEAKLKMNVQGKIQAATPKSLLSYQQAFSKIAAEAKTAIGSTKDKSKQSKIAPVLNAAAKTAVACKEYGQLIKKIHGKDIPVAVYLIVEDHRILIAKTPSAVHFKR